jgi:hypothetical protein
MNRPGRSEAPEVFLLHQEPPVPFGPEPGTFTREEPCLPKTVCRLPRHLTRRACARRSGSCCAARTTMAEGRRRGHRRAAGLSPTTKRPAGTAGAGAVRSASAPRRRDEGSEVAARAADAGTGRVAAAGHLRRVRRAVVVAPAAAAPRADRDDVAVAGGHADGRRAVAAASSAAPTPAPEAVGLGASAAARTSDLNVLAWSADWARYRAAEPER